MLAWGRVHRLQHCQKAPAFRHQTAFSEGLINTPYGQGRSYGDVALNAGGCLVRTHKLNRLLSFNRSTGLLRAEAGTTLADVLEVAVPEGWFLPVTPGTKFVSLGGAVANDVHGKNHHRVGSFGAHVRALSLRRSDGSVQVLRFGDSLFALTISGLGLTGLIEWVEVQLIPIRSVNMWVENTRFSCLDAFFDLSNASKTWPYCVAWVDCFARGARLGQGVFTRARHSLKPDLAARARAVIGAYGAGRPRLSWPVETPSWLLNRYSIATFNGLYRRRAGASYVGLVDYDPYFYPLDSIANWNRLYGPRGFYQHQCLIPKPAAREGIAALLKTISSRSQGSFLTVLKNHGVETSPGLNSFCFEGTSLAMDFANKGAATLNLLGELEAIVRSFGGRIYAAKDSTMTSATYRAMYPNWTLLEAARDPQLNSAFWMRVTGDAP